MLATDGVHEPGPTTPGRLTLHLHSRDFLPSEQGRHASYKALVLARLRSDSSRAAAVSARASLAADGITTTNLLPADTNPLFSASAADIKGPVVSGVGQGSGEYFSRVGVGRPARQLYMVLDTGSDVTWLQCQPCADCYAQSDPVYDPSLSASYAAVGCDSPRCHDLDAAACRLPQRHGGMPLRGRLRGRLLHRGRLRDRDAHAGGLRAGLRRRHRVRPRQRGPLRRGRRPARARRGAALVPVPDLRHRLLLLPRRPRLPLRLHPPLRHRHRSPVRRGSRRDGAAGPQPADEHLLLRGADRHLRRRLPARHPAFNLHDGRRGVGRRDRGLRHGGHAAPVLRLRRAPRRLRAGHAVASQDLGRLPLRHLLRPVGPVERAGARGGAAVRGRRGAEAAGQELPDPRGRRRHVLPRVRGHQRRRVHRRERAAAGGPRLLRHRQEHRRLRRQQVLAELLPDRVSLVE